jgi:hypothetical protein
MQESAKVKVAIDVDALGNQIAEMSAHIDAAMHRLLAAIREFDVASGWHVQGALSCAHWLAWRVGWDLRTARERVRVARKLAELPLVDEQLRIGAMSYSQARAISRVATADNEELWVGYAKHMPASQLDTLCRSYQNVLAYDQERGAGAMAAAQVAALRTVTRRSLDNGMVKFEIVLPSDEAAIVWAALNAALAKADAEPTSGAEAISAESTLAAPTPASRFMTDETPAEPSTAEQTPAEQTPAEQTPAEPRCEAPSPTAKAAASADRGRQRADAFMDIIQDRVRGARPGRTPIEIIITVPHAGLHGSAEPSDLAMMADGEVIAASTARRLCCDAGVVVATVDPHGQPLSIGRKTRTILAAIKRALRLRDRTCRFPGCTHSRYVDGHHGGETALSNLMLLCSARHTLLHEAAVA